MEPSDQSDRPARLLCYATPHGYGPVSKLVALSRELKARDPKIELAFAGEDGALRFVRENPGVFDESLEAPLYSQPHLVRDALSRRGPFDAAVVFKHPQLLHSLAQAAPGLPVFYFDHHFWLGSWDRSLLDCPSLAGMPLHLYAQRFVEPDQSREAAAGRDVRFIGPMLDLGDDASGIPARGYALCQLGGRSTPHVAANNFYVAAVVGCAIEACSRLGKDPALALFGFPVLSKRLPHVLFEEGGHARYMALLKGAELLIVPPGANSFYEACALRKKVVFLPPQAYNQWHYLNELRQRGLAPHVIAWEDIGLTPDSVDRRDPAEVVQQFQEYGSRLMSKGPLRGRFVESLADRVRQSLADEAQGARSHSFFESLGGNSTAWVAEDILAQLALSRPPVVS